MVQSLPKARTSRRLLVQVLLLLPPPPPLLLLLPPFSIQTVSGANIGIEAHRTSLSPLRRRKCQHRVNVFKIRGGGNDWAVSNNNGKNEMPHNLSSSATSRLNRSRFLRLKMWETCILAVLVWIFIGTIFYSKINDWPLPTAFFYAVDAGMSIGFCTEVAEKTIRSRAFSILFILLGASVVGGALALLIADLLEGVSRTITFEYRSMIEDNAFTKNDKDQDGYLTYQEAKHLLLEAGYKLTEDQLQYICERLDKDEDLRMSRKELKGVFRKIDLFLSGTDIFRRRRWTRRLLPDSSSIEEGKYFMYLVFFGWVFMGISWGMVNQGWDIITATHFAVSALATGGLTAPPVNEQGVLPTDVALFVGIFSLLGVPLFYLAMGHSAKLLVHSLLTDVEKRNIRTPLQPFEYRIGTQLTSNQDEYIHLSDFIVLQFLRRGLTDISTIQVMKEHFEEMDTNGDGKLTYEEATAMCPRQQLPGDIDAR